MHAAYLSSCNAPTRAMAKGLLAQAKQLLADPQALAGMGWAQVYAAGPTTANLTAYLTHHMGAYDVAAAQPGPEGAPPAYVVRCALAMLATGKA